MSRCLLLGIDIWPPLVTFHIFNYVRLIDLSVQVKSIWGSFFINNLFIQVKSTWLQLTVTILNRVELPVPDLNTLQVQLNLS